MAEYDDNEHNNAYDRATNFDASTYIEFARIIHNYDDTADVDHDNIDYEPDDNYDSTEYDDNGVRVYLYGVILNFLANFDDAVDTDYFNDDYDYDYETVDYDFKLPSRYSFPLYDIFRSPCKRTRNNYKYGSKFYYPPSF